MNDMLYAVIKFCRVFEQNRNIAEEWKIRCHAEVSMTTVTMSWFHGAKLL